MRLAFTICSANYLPFALSLGKSLLQHNEDYQFIIVLLDRYEKTDNLPLGSIQLIPIEEMRIAEFDELNNRYNIFELSCAVKPFVAEFLCNRFKEALTICYLDCDILVFDRLLELEQQLEQSAIALTPHINTPIPEDGKFSNEITILRAGIYNAGFFAIKPGRDAFEFLKWWKDKLKRYCYNDVNKGLFVDQVWLSFVPILFDKVCIIHHPGYNISYWNLHERTIGDNKIVNREFPLIFYHFSGFDIENSSVLSKHQNRYDFQTNPELVPLYKQYTTEAMKNGYNKFKSLIPFYGVKKSAKKKGIKRFTNFFLRRK